MIISSQLFGETDAERELRFLAAEAEVTTLFTEPSFNVDITGWLSVIFVIFEGVVTLFGGLVSHQDGEHEVNDFKLTGGHEKVK